MINSLDIGWKKTRHQVFFDLARQMSEVDTTSVGTYLLFLCVARDVFAAQQAFFSHRGRTAPTACLPLHSFLEKLDGRITPGNIFCFKHQPSQQRQVE